MKVILSRKGYDSASGGVPSPIFPDGALVSLPIPSDQRPCLADIRFGGMNLGSVVQELTGRGCVGKMGVHLDPDLDRTAVPRRRNWRPCFGQVGAPQTHLENQDVGKGDIFLFFGWFREVSREHGTLGYRRESPDIHCLFGWLQVGEIYHLGMEGRAAPIWAADHPHVKDAGSYWTNNTLYVAADQLRVPGIRRAVAGGGVFRSFASQLCLTAPGRNRSVWRLPCSFYPSKGAPALSYHADMRRWQRDKSGVLLSTVARGQEFVLDCNLYPDVIQWLNDIFKAVPTTGSSGCRTRRRR